MARFILVHGASHAGWCWERIVKRLQAAGHEVVAPDLPGHGSDKTPKSEVTLASYIDHIAAILDAAPGKSVLVGHSMGGLTIAGAAEARPEKVERLVYVTAYPPVDGDSVGSIMAADPSSKVPAVTEVVENGTCVVVADHAVADIFYNDCSPTDVADAKSRLEPEPAAPLGAPVALTETRYGRIPRTFVGCREDHCIAHAYQKQIAARAGCTWLGDIEAGHSPFLSKPDELAALLAR
jgi:pimeloyl-ACP methyl ester carboxylesterase